MYGPSTTIVRFEAQQSEQSNLRADELRALNLGLTAREAHVFAHMARGLGNREIARDLGISPNTARAHLRNIYEKLGVSSRVEALNRARDAVI